MFFLNAITLILAFDAKFIGQGVDFQSLLHARSNELLHIASKYGKFETRLTTPLYSYGLGWSLTAL